MNYLCLIDGVVEFGASDLAQFAHYIAIYEEEILEALRCGGTVEMKGLSDEEYYFGGDND